MKDLLGQELDKGDLVAVVWADGAMTTARIYGFKTRQKQVYATDDFGNILRDSDGRARYDWKPYYYEARVVTASGSRKTKTSNQIVRIVRIASLDHNDNLVLN